MKFFILFALLASTQALSQEEIHREWIQFKATHDRLYRSALEERKRFSIFKTNLKEIEEHNELYKLGEVSYEAGVTEFADMTSEEFMNFVGESVEQEEFDSENVEYFTRTGRSDNTTVLDWRDYGAVTPPKSQGGCGSCWSFATTGVLEGRNKLKTGKLISLSEQNLIDCSGRKYGTFGCEGGNRPGALHFVKDHGITTEQKYPYTGRKGYCRYTPKANVVNVTAVVRVTSGDEAALRDALYEGPVTVGIAVVSKFRYYKRGVYTDATCSKTRLNHAVLAVGYGVENGQDYWLVKNSWGTRWGLSGFVKIKLGENTCGIATSPAYPKL